MITKCLLAVLCLIISVSTFAQQYFTEIYPLESTWKVDHFKAEEGKLQDLILSRSFTYKYQALAFAKTLRKSSNFSGLNFVATEAKNTKLWEVKHNWSLEWEKTYAAWIEENLDQDYFVRNNLATDCADVAYALRWIFSRINHLPAAGTLAGSLTLVTHEVMRAHWLKLPTHSEWQKDRRFLAALRWILDNVYTKTLYKDSYPVSLVKETIRPGLINLTNYGTHTEVFSKVSWDPESSPLEVMSSGLPVKVRRLSKRLFMDRLSGSQGTGGLRQFRWPIIVNQKWVLVSGESMPNYSLEQYTSEVCENITSFAFCIMHRLGIEFKPELILRKLLTDHQTAIQERISFVNDTVKFCKTHDCSPGTLAYEDYGTPSRDKRLLNNFKSIEYMASALEFEETYQVWLASMSIPNLPEKLSMFELQERLSKGLVSFDPRLSVAARWALTPEGVEESVVQRLDANTVLREKLLLRASGCRDNPVACKKNPANFEELSSFELDIEQRETLENWWTYCIKVACAPKAKFLKTFNQVWSQSPAPWDSLKARQGTPLPLNGHVLNTHEIQVIVERYLILDSNRIYDIAKRQIVNFGFTPDFVGFDEALKTFSVVRKGRVTFYDLELSALWTFEPPIGERVARTVHHFGNGSVLVQDCSTEYDCDRVAYSAWLIDLGLRSVSRQYSVSKMDKERDTGTGISLTGPQAVVFLSPDGGDVRETTVPLSNEISGIGNFYNISPGVILASGWYEREAWVAFIKDGVRNLILKDWYVSLWNINSQYFSIDHYDPSTGTKMQSVLDRQGTFWARGGRVSCPVAVGFEKSICLTTKPGQQKEAFIFSGTQIIPFQYPVGAEIKGAWDDFYSTLNSNGESSLLDYQGRMLESSTDSIKMNCGSWKFFKYCSEPGQELILEIFFLKLAEEEIYPRRYTKVGLRRGTGFDSVYVYVLESRASWFQKKAPARREKKLKEQGAGKVLRLHDSLFLWLP